MIKVNSTSLGLDIDIDNPIALLRGILIMRIYFGMLPTQFTNSMLPYPTATLLMNHWPFPVLGHHPFLVYPFKFSLMKTSVYKQYQD